MKILWGPDFRQGLDQALRRTLTHGSAEPNCAWESKAFNYELPGTQAIAYLPGFEDLRLAHLPEAEWVFLLEPHKRLPPRQSWQSPLPLIAFADLPIGLSEADTHQVFALYDGIVALSEAAFSLFQRLGLPVLETRWLGFDPVVHAPLPEPAQLYDLIYIASNGYSPALPAYEALPAPWKCHYFISTTPAFLPFYFQRSRYVICDEPSLSARMLEVLACGAILLCPAGLTGLPACLQAGEHFLSYAPGQVESVLAALAELEAEPLRQQQIKAAVQTALAGLTYPACFQALQAELNEKSVLLRQRVENRLRQAQTSPLRLRESEVLTLVQAENPLSLVLLPEWLNDPIYLRDQRYYSYLASNYVRAAFHPLNLTAASPLFQVAQQCLAELPSPLQALQTLVWAWKQQQWGVALHHLQAFDLAALSLENFPPLLLAQDRIYALLSVWYPPEQAWALSLKTIELECLQGLGRWQELREAAEQALAQAPLAPFFQLYLQALSSLQDGPALVKAYAAAQAACPLEIPFRLHGAALLGESQPEQALAQLQAGRDLAQRHMMALESVEIFHALERLIWQKMPALPVETPHTGYLLWEGAIQSHHSLAKINRRLLALLQADPDLYFTALPFHPPEFAESEPLADLQNHAQLPDALISHRWPPRLLPPQQGKWVNILPWEHGVLPTDWVQKFNAALDQVWVPSAFVARSFEHSGLLPERIRVIPNGVDTALYHPQGPIWPLPERKKTVFLFVGGLIQRKGVDLLLKAYAQAFSAEDDVMLVIKGFGDQGVYSTGSLAEPLAFFRENPAAPALHLITRSDLSEQDLASLYRACDVYVHPYRGEGFGLPILEAMACGLPVVVPEAGPAPEFSSTESAWYLPTWTAFELGKSLGDIGLTPYFPYYHEVDIDALAGCLQAIAADPAAIAQKGPVARKEAEAFSWQAMATRIRTEISGLCNGLPAVREVAGQAQSAWHTALEAVGHWPETSALPIPDTVEPCLPYLQRLLELCLHSGQPEKFKTYLRHAWEHGLSLQQYLRLNLVEVDLEKRPLRVYWPAPPLFLMAAPDSGALLQFLPVPGQTRFQLQTQAPFSDTPSQAAATWAWLQTPEQTLPALNAAVAVFYAHPEQGQALKHGGWPEEQLLYLPPAVNFELFSPQTLPLILDESQGRFSFFACLNFSDSAARALRWQHVLRAYLQTFAEPEAVNLVIKPLQSSFDSALEQVMAWLENQGFDAEQIPSLTFVQEDLGPHNLPGLYTGTQVFLDVDPASNGHWALAAQAAGCKVIACGQFPFLQRPFAEQADLGDPAQFSWLLRKAFAQPLPQLQHSGQAVREYLRAEHDWPRWQQRIQTFAGRSFLRQFF